MIPPTGPLTLATLGTSLTLNGGWQAPLRLALESCSGRSISVLNFGGGGMASDWGVLQLPALIAANPNIVLIEFSINDAYTPYGITLAQSSAQLSVLVDLLRNNNIFPVLMTMNQTHGDVAQWRPRLADYYETCRHVGLATKAPLIDNANVWASYSPEALAAAIPDGVHPTPEAVSAVLVPLAVQALCPLI